MSSRETPTRPRNVLLIVLDQWRADAFGRAIGHPSLTPALDRLAARGVSFVRHYGQATPCGPARASLLTGQYQHNHGVMRNGTPLDARFTNLALQARMAGYHPALFGYTDAAVDPRQRAPDDPALRSYEQVLPGFTPELHLTEHPLPWMAWLLRRGHAFADDRHALYQPAPMAGARGPTHAPTRFPAEHSISAFLTDELLAYLSVRRTQSWFVHAAYIRPHPPFIAAAPFHDRHHPDDMPAPRRARSADDEAAVHPLVGACVRGKRTTAFYAQGGGPVTELPDAHLAQLRATYRGMVSEVDAQVGRLLDALRAWDLLEHTLVVITADHGEMLGDHWMLGKDSPFEQAYHVPLIVHDPDAAADGTRGRLEERFTEAVDVMPTILRWLGRPVPRQCDGRSLLGLIHGETPADWRDAAHWGFDFRDSWLPNAQSVLGLPMDLCGMLALRTREHCYLHFAALPPLLYDLRRDPDCLHDIAGDPTSREARLHCAEALLTWRLRSTARELTGMSTAPQGLIVRE